MLKVLLVFAGISCLLPSSFAKESNSQLARNEDQVRKVVSSFVQSFENLDWQNFRTCFAEDATIFYPEFYPHRVQGKGQVDVSWQRVFENIRTQSGKSTSPYMVLKPADVRVQMLGEVAIVTFHIEHGGTAVGRRTLVLNKTRDGWRIVHLHGSNVNFGSTGN